MDDVALRCYIMTPTCEPKLTNCDEVQETNRGLKVSKVPCSNGIPNSALKHLPQRAVSHLAEIFNSDLLIHHLLQCGSTLE